MPSTCPSLLQISLPGFDTVSRTFVPGVLIPWTTSQDAAASRLPVTHLCFPVTSGRGRSRRASEVRGHADGCALFPTREGTTQLLPPAQASLSLIPVGPQAPDLRGVTSWVTLPVWVWAHLDAA